MMKYLRNTPTVLENFVIINSAAVAFAEQSVDNLTLCKR